MWLNFVSIPCSKYNGKYGEEGMEGQGDVSAAWREFLTAQGNALSEEDWKLCASFVFEQLPTTAWVRPDWPLAPAVGVWGGARGSAEGSVGGGHLLISPHSTTGRE